MLPTVFEEGLRRMQDWIALGLNGKEPNILPTLVEDLTADAHLFSVDISVEPKMIELTVAEKNSQAFFNNRILFYQRCLFIV